jgi:hypothetical protein
MKRTSGTDERLRGIAPSVEAGATNFPLLDHGDARAPTACFGGGGTPGGASADDDQIVWCAGTPRHRISLLVTSRAIESIPAGSREACRETGNSVADTGPAAPLLRRVV